MSSSAGSNDSALTGIFSFSNNYCRYLFIIKGGSRHSVYAENSLKQQSLNGSSGVYAHGANEEVVKEQADHSSPRDGKR